MEDEAGLQAANTVSTADAKQDITSRFVAMWEKKNAQRALRGGAVSTMALTLAACGGDDDDPVVTSSDDSADDVVEPVNSDLTIRGDEIAANAGDDTITGRLAEGNVNTLNSSDVIAGGDGTDTLDVVTNGADVAPTITGLEKLVVRSQENNSTIDFSNEDGSLEEIRLESSTEDTVFNEIQSNSKIVLVDLDGVEGDFQFADDVLGADAALELELDGVDTGARDVDVDYGANDSLASLSIAAVNNESMVDINDDGDSFTSLTVTGDAAIEFENMAGEPRSRRSTSVIILA